MVYDKINGFWLIDIYEIYAVHAVFQFYGMDIQLQILNDQGNATIRCRNCNWVTHQKKLVGNHYAKKKPSLFMKLYKMLLNSVRQYL